MSSHPNFGFFFVAPDRLYRDSGSKPSRVLMLFGHEIFEEFQLMWWRYLNVTGSRKNRQTDGKQYLSRAGKWLRKN